MWSKVVSEFKVGDKLTKTVGKVSDIYGVFFELLPGFDALAHVSNIRGLGGRRPSSLFETGQELPVQIIEMDERRMRVQLTVDASGMEEVAAPERPGREPAYKAVELWSMNNPEKAQAAEDWLREQTKDAPMHGSRLGELVNLFGVPRPVSAWLRWLGGYESLPPMNKYIPSPRWWCSSRGWTTRRTGAHPRRRRGKWIQTAGPTRPGRRPARTPSPCSWWTGRTSCLRRSPKGAGARCSGC